jgi:putative autotransporter adhesin-like protein
MNRTHPHAPLCDTVQHALLRSGVVWLLALPWIAGVTPAHADTVVGSGKAASETRAIAAFSAISLKGSLALELRQGSPTSVVVHGDDNLLPLVESIVDSDQTLQLHWKNGTSVRTGTRTWVEVIAPQIRAVSSAGSGAITIDTMKVPRLALSTSGSGDVRAKALNNDELSLAISGAGKASLVGRAARVQLDISGSGGIDATELRADDVSVSIAGSGAASVHAARTLAVSIAGSGDVTYSGDPTVQRSIAGSGQVRKR